MVIARETRDIDDRTDELRELAGNNPDIWSDFSNRYELSWIYHEHALEGVVLTHAEVNSALKGRPIAPETYQNIRNLRLAVDQVKREAREGAKLNLDLVLRLHATLCGGEVDREGARYRKDIPLHRAYFHDIAQPHVIASRLRKLCEWATENEPEDDDAVRFAAQFHHDYMAIFPFTEHTGKVGRLLINFILLRYGYMPVVLHATERQRYYDTLRLPKKEMENFLMDAVHNCIDNGTNFINQVLAERAKEAERRRLRAI